MSDLVGETIGPYRITERLGRGGMADVYKAFHTKLEIHRAIKFIRPEFVTSDDFRARFQKEAQGVAMLRHPNIVQIHDFGESEHRYYMVMEYVEGETLKEKLARQGSLPIPETIELTRHIASALAYAHGRDLIHRDIKPDNIMIDTDGRPVLMDFGIAKLLTNETQLTQTGMGIGTPAYMAPEQAKALEVGPPADIYALSIVLFEMLTGQVPFSADTPMAVMLKALSDPMPMPRSFNADISEALQGVILTGTAKEPEQRYQRVQDFLNALDAAAQPTAQGSNEPTSPAPAAPAANATPPGKRGRTPVYIGVAAALIVAVGAGYLLMPGDADSAPESGRDEEPVAQATPQPATAAAAETTSTPGNPTSQPTQPPTAIDESSVKYAYRQEIAADEVVSSQIPLEAGDTVFLQVYDTAHTTDFRLMKPDGREQVFSSYNDAGPVEIEQSGNHELSISMRSGRSGAVDVELLKIEPAVIEAGELAANAYFSGRTDWPGQLIAGTLNLEAGQHVYLDVVRSDVTTDFRLHSPDGRKQIFSSYNDTGPVEVDRSGAYRFTADPRSDTKGDFELRLVVLDPPVIDGGAYELNTFFSGETAQPGQAVKYTVNLKEGDVLFFHRERASKTTDFTLTAPDGRTKVFKTYGDSGPVATRSTGLHTLHVDPRSDAVVEYEAILYRLQPPLIDGGRVDAGDTISGESRQPGQTLEYAVQFPEGGSWAFKRIETSGTTDFRLFGPNNGKKYMDTYSDVRSFEIPEGGTYRLEVDPRSDGFGPFSARFERP